MGRTTLTSWPFGVALFHLIEDLVLESIAELAVWRRVSYERNMRQALEDLRRLVGGEVAGGSR